MFHWDLFLQLFVLIHIDFYCHYFWIWKKEFFYFSSDFDFAKINKNLRNIALSKIQVYNKKKNDSKIFEKKNRTKKFQPNKKASNSFISCYFSLLRNIWVKKWTQKKTFLFCWACAKPKAEYKKLNCKKYLKKI
jgi:hypothetical protein